MYDLVIAAGNLGFFDQVFQYFAVFYFGYAKDGHAIGRFFYGQFGNHPRQVVHLFLVLLCIPKVGASWQKIFVVDRCVVFKVKQVLEVVKT